MGDNWPEPDDDDECLWERLGSGEASRTKSIARIKQMNHAVCILVTLNSFHFKNSDYASTDCSLRDTKLEIS